MKIVELVFVIDVGKKKPGASLAWFEALFT
jgi:hypothetical protein